MTDNLYLQRYAYPKELIGQAPHPDLGIVVVIPCYHEPDLIKTLDSLNNCAPTSCAAEIIVVINQSEDCSEEVSQFNLTTFQAAQEWAEKNSSQKRNYHILFEELPPKHAGVGLARKIGMDEAVRRFEKIERSGIIVCFDADCTCQSNYLTAIESHFKKNKRSTAANIYFEHPLTGSLSPAIYQGIENYELFLRYYRQALHFCGYPYAYFAVGSCMVVRSSAYQKQGGMNRRKAGEDFYFIEEHSRMGTITEITDTTVFPSPRVSDRVPFGTGKRQSQWIQSDQQQYSTFNPKSFQLLRSLLADPHKYYGLSIGEIRDRFGSYSDELQNYLTNMSVADKIDRCGKKTKQFNAFKKCFFQYFDGLWILQFLHHFQKIHKDVDLSKAAQWMLKQRTGTILENANISALLRACREMDKGSNKVH